MILASLDLPPIFHWSYPVALVASLAIALIAIRQPLARAHGPSAAWTPFPASRWRSLALLLALGVSAFAIYLAIFGIHTWPPTSSDRRAGWGLLALTALAALLALFNVSTHLDPADPAAPTSRMPPFVWVTLFSVLFASAGAMMALWTRLVSPSEPAERTAAIVTIPIAAATAALMALPLSALDRRGSPFSAAFILAGVALAGAAAILGSGSIALGQITLAIAVPALALAIACAIKPGGSIGSLTIALASAAITMLLLAARTFSYLPTHAPFILAAAPLAGFITHTLLPRSLSPKLRAALVIIISAITAAAAVASAVSIPTDSASSTDY